MRTHHHRNGNADTVQCSTLGRKAWPLLGGTVAFLWQHPKRHHGRFEATSPDTATKEHHGGEQYVHITYNNYLHYTR
jgi:hypothetical protein